MTWAEHDRARARTLRLRSRSLVARGPARPQPAGVPAWTLAQRGHGPRRAAISAPTLRRFRPGRLLGGHRGRAQPADRPGRARPQRRHRSVRAALRPLPGRRSTGSSTTGPGPRPWPRTSPPRRSSARCASMNGFRWQGKDFGAWLMTIARNLTHDHFKAGRTRLELTTEDMGAHDDATEGPETAVLAGLTNEVLLEALARAADRAARLPGHALPPGPEHRRDRRGPRSQRGRGQAAAAARRTQPRRS